MERQIRLAMLPGSMPLIASSIAGKGIEQLGGNVHCNVPPLSKTLSLPIRSVAVKRGPPSRQECLSCLFLSPSRDGQPRVQTKHGSAPPTFTKERAKNVARTTSHGTAPLLDEKKIRFNDVAWILYG